MTRPFDKHLDNDELDELVSLQAQGVPESGHFPDGGLGEAQRHLESCEDCNRKLQMHRKVQGEILRLGSPTSAARGSGCPEEDADWLQVAAGLLSEAKAKEFMSHAAQCDHCGPLLRKAAETIADETTPAEESTLANLDSARPDGQRDMAETLQRGAQPAPRKRYTLRWIIFAVPPLARFGALATVLGLAVWFGLRTARTPDVDELLARAYSEKRTMELRMPGSNYAPLRMERSVPESTTELPQSLLDANALISRELRTHPDDPKWLQAKARADLLQFHYDSAVQTLRRALDVQPGSPSLMVDLASAHYQRGFANKDREVDYGMAIDYLGRALAITPDDPVALFNRALSEEKLHLYTPAIEDWNHYLRIDPSGSWAEEARRHLEAVKNKVRNKEISLRRPLLGTAELASFADRRSLTGELGDRLESYLHDAITRWIPQAFPQAAHAADRRQVREAKIALAALAEVTQAQHADAWVNDLLAGDHGVEFETAVNLLSTAVNANDNGDYVGGQKAAHAASNLFRSAGNLAGELRAREEEVYSYHLLYDGRRCMTLVRGLLAQLQEQSYEWLRAQTSLEESNCSGLIGDLGGQRTAIERGIIRAAKHNYSALLLRGLGFRADAAASLGNAQLGFSVASSGLDVFWSTDVDLMKGYNLYTDIDTAADILRLPYLQVALWEEATTLIDLHPDLVQRAMAHRWFGNSAYLASMVNLAAVEFAKAGALFAAAPPTEATMRGQIDADIWLAGLETRQGEVNRADTRLQRVQRNLERAPSFGPQIGFYTTQAELRLRSKDWVNAELALRSATFLAEWALRTFPSENARRQWAKQTQNTYRNLVAWKIQQSDARSALELWEWYKGAELRAARNEAPWPSDGLDQVVPPDAQNARALEIPTTVADNLSSLRERTVISYAVFPDGTAVWVYDNRGIFSQWIGKTRAELQTRSTQFHHLCSTPDSSVPALRSAARTLYDLLIEPIKEHLTPGRTLIFDLDDVLSSIPMEALIGQDGRYLLEHSAVVVSPGFYQTLHLRRPAAIDSESSALIVSAPAPGETGLLPLPDAEREGEMVAEHFRSARLLTGAAASLAAVLHELRGARLFHFAGHAVALPEMNGLLLARFDDHTQRTSLLNSESLRSDAVQELQLAVLSACDTSTAPQAGNSGTENLAQSLLRAGVPHVIASLWSVDSAGTAVFMKEFYAQLLSGVDVVNSVRAAKLLLATNPISSHPYYWAPFEIAGTI